MLIPTGSAFALHPSPTGAMDAAANAEGAALADSTFAGAAADALPAEVTTAGEAADTVGAEIVTAPAAADTADVVPAEVNTSGAAAGVSSAKVTKAAATAAADAVPDDVLTTTVAADTAGAVFNVITMTGAAAADAVLSENFRAAAPAAADTATKVVATAGWVAGKMNLLSHVADQTAGDAADAAFAAKTQTDTACSHVPCGKHVSMADELCKGSHAAFIASAAFTGGKAGMLFKTGDQGLGYYANTIHLTPNGPLASPSVVESRCTATSLVAKELKGHYNHADVDPRPISASVTMSPTSTASCVDNASAPLSSQAPLVKEVLHSGKAMHAGQKEAEALEGDSQGRYAAGVDGQVKGERVCGKGDDGDKTGHYWGQALQYLDCSVQVRHPL